MIDNIKPHPALACYRCTKPMYTFVLVRTVFIAGAKRYRHAVMLGNRAGTVPMHVATVRFWPGSHISLVYRQTV